MNLEILLQEISSAFETSNVPKLEELITDHSVFIKENGLEILPAFVTKFTVKLKESNDHFKQYYNLFKSLTENCSADDVILTLHKEITETQDHATFLHLLEPLKNALLKLPVTKVNYFVWSFDAIQTFLYDLQMLNETSDSSEINSEMPEEGIKQLNLICEQVADFYIEITNYLQNSQHSNVPLKYIINLFGKSLIDLSASSLSTLRTSIERTMEFVLKICDPYRFFDADYLREIYTEDMEINKVAIGHFFYLLRIEKLGLEKTPKVYTDAYVLHGMLEYVIVLLKLDESSATEKALLLAEDVTNLKGLTSDLLDNPMHCRFSLILSNVIHYNSERPNRMKALEVMKQYILSFNNKGRCLLITNIFHGCNQSGLMGYLITMYKDLLVHEFKSQVMDELFVGEKLACVIRQFCYLPPSKFDNLVQHADHIVAALNLLIYHIKRDQCSNITGVQFLITEIKSQLIAPLKNALESSKNECDLCIKDMEKRIAHGDDSGGKKDAKVSVMVSGQELPSGSVVENLNILRSSMTALSLIELVLCRLLESIEI